MLSFIRRQMSVTNLMVVAALIFAMAGGAFAANGGGRGHAAGHHGHASKKGKGKKGKPLAKRGPRGPRGPEGKQGPEGKEGPAGKEGPTGKEGAAGKKGTEGKEGKQGIQGIQGKQGIQGLVGEDGESVTVTALTKGSEPNQAAECKELGGAKLSNNTGTAFVCNGEAGAGGGGGCTTLKSGETETGMWGGTATALVGTLYYGFAPVTFTCPLAAAPSNVDEVKEGVSKKDAACPGSISKPEATVSTTVCVYIGEEDNMIGVVKAIDSPSGVVLQLEGKAAANYAYGAWAVTG